MFEVAVRPFLRIALSLLLLSPFLIWLFRIDIWHAPPPQDLALMAQRSLLQAGLSAAASVVFGTLIFFGAQGFRGLRVRRWIETILLLPNLLPPLFVVIALLSLGLGSIVPLGIGAVVLAHALLNGGLVAVALERIFQQKMGGMLELAAVEGASRWQVFIKGVLPYLKGDFFSLFIFIFSLSWTSLSIPLVLGGAQASSFEIAIYQMIRMNGEWSKAVVLAVLQSLSLFLVTLIVPSPSSPSRSSRSVVAVLGYKALRPLVFFPILFLCVGWLVNFYKPNLSFDMDLLALVVPALVNTLVISLSVGLMTLFFLVVSAYLLPHRGLVRFLNGYLAPSGVIIGFAFLLVPGDSEEIMNLKLALALTLWTFPMLFRWLAGPTLSSLRGQIELARTLGSSYWQILWEIVLPQSATAFFMAAGLASMWACGDFVLASILSGGQWTWALLIENLMSSYRLDVAAVMLIPLLILSLLCYGFFRGIGRYVVG